MYSVARSSSHSQTFMPAPVPGITFVVNDLGDFRDFTTIWTGNLFRFVISIIAPLGGFTGLCRFIRSQAL